jgi:hypothetical protein
MKPPASSSRPHGRPFKPGFSLVEVVLATIVMAITVGAMSSVLLLGLKNIDNPTTPAAKAASGRAAIDEITADLATATAFTENSLHAVTFTVPDRTGDRTPETLRYAWSGAAGAPLTRTFNGTSSTFVDDVHGLDFSYLLKTIQAEESGHRLLMVVGGSATSLASDDTARKAKLEEWGYTVTTISDAATQADIDAAVAVSDVAYISETTYSYTLGTRMANAAIGVVDEEIQLYDEFKISSSINYTSSSTVSVTDNSHYITSAFATGSLTAFSSSAYQNNFSGTLAGGAQVLAKDPANNYASLIAINTGGSLYGGGAAPGRRVTLPWCVTDINDYSRLTSNALTITRRAIDWAAGNVTTFGFKAAFTSAEQSVHRKQIATQVDLSDALTVTSITAYVGGDNSDLVRYAIYTDSSGEPDTLIAQTTTATSAAGSVNWLTITLLPTNLTAGTYWLALSLEHDKQGYRYENTGGKTRYNDTRAVTDGFSSSWGTSTSSLTRHVSIYASGTP